MPKKKVAAIQPKADAPSPRHTPMYVFKIVSYHGSKDGSVNPKNITYAVGVTWFRIRSFLGSLFGVDSSSVLLEAVSELQELGKGPHRITVIKVPDNDLA